MAYTPDLDWVDDAPPGFDTERMNKMQLGITDAASVADSAATTAAQALSDAASAQQTADEALANAGSGGVHTVDDDVKRIYSAGTTPPDGAQPGDLVLSAAPATQGPAALPGLLTWLDASATGARDLSSVLPDVSGNGNDYEYRSDVSSQVAAVDRLNGLPAFSFGGSCAYWMPGTRTGERTISGAVRFDGIPSGTDSTLIYTGGTLALDIGVRHTSGNLFCSVEGATIYDAPLAWGSGRAYVSFVITLSASQSTLYLDGVQVGKLAEPTTLSRGSLVFSRNAPADFHGLLGEFAEHEGYAAPSSGVAMLAAYYRAKWRI